MSRLEDSIREHVAQLRLAAIMLKEPRRFAVDALIEMAVDLELMAEDMEGGLSNGE